MATARAEDPGEAVAKEAAFEVLTESGLDVKWDVAGEFTILPTGSQIGLQVLADSLVQVGSGRDIGATV